MGGHPEKCPEITRLAGMFGLGLSPEAAKLLILTGEPIEEALAWIDACPTCSQNLATLDRWQDEVGYPDLAVVAQERDVARELWKKLQDIPTESLPDHIGDEHLFWAMSRLLQQKSREAVRFSTDRAILLGQMAVHLADVLPEAFYTPCLLADLKARARAFFGNSLRVAGRAAQADAVFKEAVRLVERGAGGAMIRATVLDFLGSLRKDQGRLPEAVEVLTRAESLYEASGRRDLVAKVNLTLGPVEQLQGNLQAAVAHLTKAQELIDPTEEPTLFVHCQHDLIYLLTEAGHYDEAELRLPLARRLYGNCEDSTNMLNLRWLEGRILRGQGNLELAREVFQEVAVGFETVGQGSQLGFLRLDQARLECELGRFDEVKRLASEAYGIFDRSNIAPRRMAALAAFSQAAEAESATVDLIQHVYRYISNPSLAQEALFSPPTTS